MNKERLLDYFGKGVRFDGRSLEDIRLLTIDYDISKYAEGSVRVRMGKTDVMVGIKMAVEEPYPDTPDEGKLMVSAELRPTASPEFELGPPREKAIEFARVVDRGVREAKAIDVKKLCIKEGELVWSVMIDLIAINDDGNLLDAFALGAIAALKNTVFPKIEDNKIDYEVKTKKKLPLLREPIAVTVYKISDYFIVDPLPSEEKAADARLTVTVTKDDTLCALQKGGSHPLTIEEIKKMTDLAIKKAKELRVKLS